MSHTGEGPRPYRLENAGGSEKWVLVVAVLKLVEINSLRLVAHERAAAANAPGWARTSGLKVRSTLVLGSVGK